MPLFDTFAQFKGFPLFLLQFLQNLIHGLGIRKERIHVFQLFLERFKDWVVPLLNFSVEKKIVVPILLCDWSMDFSQIKYMYVNTNCFHSNPFSQSYAPF